MQNIQNILGEVYESAEKIENVVKGVLGIEAFKNAE
jgi:hypothetical protein